MNEALSTISAWRSIVSRIVAILTRLIPRTQSVAEAAIEYEYRDAEYEYEENLIARRFRWQLFIAKKTSSPGTA